MKFLLNCRVELTPEENELIKKYKADGEVLEYIKIEGDPKQSGILVINNLIAGKTYECKDVVGLLEIEEKIKNPCKNFKTLLVVMDSFGGEELVEY